MGESILQEGILQTSSNSAPPHDVRQPCCQSIYATIKWIRITSSRSQRQYPAGLSNNTHQLINSFLCFRTSHWNLGDIVMRLK